MARPHVRDSIFFHGVRKRIRTVGKLPALHNVQILAGHGHRAALAEHGERVAEVIGKHVHRALDGRIGAILKANEREAHVLGLDVRVGQAVGVGEHLVRVAERPLQEIGIVDALVHERAAVVFPGAAPFPGVKVRLVAVAADLRRAVQKTAEAAVRNFRVQCAH